MDKYCLTDEKIINNGRTLYRIKALKDFSHVEAGDLGGFIEKEENLSQEGRAWVGENAQVYGNARVYEDAQVYDNAWVSSNAKIYGKAWIHDNARIWGDVQVYGNARVRGNARICGSSQVYDDAQVYDSARVRDNAKVYGKAHISGNSTICENAKIFNYARILGHSYIYGNVQIEQKIVIKDADCNFLTLEENIRCQTGLIPLNGKVIAYKQVRKDLTSFYDNDFQYKIGEWVEAKSFEISNESCAAGLHFSNANYWNHAENLEESSFLIAEIRLEDIITVQEGKIRCKKAFILGKYDAPAQD